MTPFYVLGTPLRATTYDELVAHLKELRNAPRTVAVDFTNTQIVTLRQA